MESATAFINYNGMILPAGGTVITADNRGFRYGDGLFETMLVQNDRIRLRDYHFDRLFSGMRLLQFDVPSFFTADHLSGQVLELCRKNGHPGPARVRLVVFRGEGGLFDPADHLPNYIIQSWPLAPGVSGELNDKGLSIDVYPDGCKACDAISNLKSNNYLLYVLAALYARKNQLDDGLVLNSRGGLADSTIANLFYIKNGQFYTPPLSEGGVAGVMRRYLLEALPRIGCSVQEQVTVPEDLTGADEVFLTNALKGISWVSSFRRTVYQNQLTTIVYRELIKKL